MAGKILLIGATEYVGGQLVPLLLEQGKKVRVMTRSKDHLASRPWAEHENLEVVSGNVFTAAHLHEAMQDCSLLYYLRRPRHDHLGLAESSRMAAYNVAQALQQSQIERVIHLDLLSPDQAQPCPRQKAATENGCILRLGSKPVTSLKIGPIIGEGSAFFEMLLSLSHGLPLRLAPKWLDSRVQALPLETLLQALSKVADIEASAGQSYDLGGEEVLSYGELLKLTTAAGRIAPHTNISAPWLSLCSSKFLIGYATPLPKDMGTDLVDEICTEPLVRDNSLRELIEFTPVSLRESLERAYSFTSYGDLGNSWQDYLPYQPAWIREGDPFHAGVLTYSLGFSAKIWGRPEQLWPVIESIGGKNKRYSHNCLWGLRAGLDRLLGGPGLKRGRRNPRKLRDGDSLDFWRVLECRPEQRLFLVSEMRQPGKGVLDFRLEKVNQAGEISEQSTELTRLSISLYFQAEGQAGKLYWRLAQPWLRQVFCGMIQGIAAQADCPCFSKAEQSPALPLR